MVDGDTIRIRRGHQMVYVRMIGIDTPELHHPNKPVQAFAVEAKQHLEALIAGRDVYLQDADSKDHYGRTLAYVQLADGTDLDLRQIADGYGFSYRKYPHARIDQYNAAERAARELGYGLWAEEK